MDGNPGIQFNPKRAGRDIWLKTKINSTDKQKTATKIPGLTGKFFSKMIPAIRGISNLKKGRDFHVGF